MTLSEIIVDELTDRLKEIAKDKTLKPSDLYMMAMESIAEFDQEWNDRQNLNDVVKIKELAFHVSALMLHIGVIASHVEDQMLKDQK